MTSSVKLDNKDVPSEDTMQQTYKHRSAKLEKVPCEAAVRNALK